MQTRSHESGSANPLLIACIMLALFSAALAGFGIWSFLNYQDQKNNTDAKIETAVNAAKTVQAKELEDQFLEREKEPYTSLKGPDDLGSVTFNYPKTWSVYVAKNGAAGEYEAYLNPGSVPAVSNTQPYATRVVIDSKQYDDTLKTYEALVKKGSLKSSPVTANGFTGIRLDGAFSKEREGSSVLFKVRDKTLIISTDATTFKNDFDTVILKSLDFNP